MGNYIKDPGAVLDYGFDWSDWLSTAETLANSTWMVEDGLTEDSDQFTDTVTLVWVSGGTVGETYTITNQVTTSASRTDERSHTITIRQR